MAFHTTHKFDHALICSCGATMEDVKDNMVSASCPDAVDPKLVERIAAKVRNLKDTEPGRSLCLTAWDIREAGANAETLHKALSLDFSHAWILDVLTDNIIAVRLPDSVEETIRVFKNMKGKNAVAAFPQEAVEAFKESFHSGELLGGMDPHRLFAKVPDGLGLNSISSPMPGDEQIIAEQEAEGLSFETLPQPPETLHYTPKAPADAILQSMLKKNRDSWSF